MQCVRFCLAKAVFRERNRWQPATRDCRSFDQQRFDSADCPAGRLSILRTCAGSRRNSGGGLSDAARLRAFINLLRLLGPAPSFELIATVRCGVFPVLMALVVRVAFSPSRTIAERAINGRDSSAGTFEHQRSRILVLRSIAFRFGRIRPRRSAHMKGRHAFCPRCQHQYGSRLRISE